MNPIVTAMSGATQKMDRTSLEEDRAVTLFVCVPFDCAPALRKAREEQQRNQFRLLSEESQKKRKWPFPPEPDLA